MGGHGGKHMTPSLGLSLLQAGRSRRLVAWLSGVALLALFQVGSASAPLVCSASSGSCAGKVIGSYCTSGFGTSNCMVTGFTGTTPSCSCPDVDCTAPGSCFETKYGLGSPTDWDVLPNGFQDELVAAGQPVLNPTHADFEGS